MHYDKSKLPTRPNIKAPMLDDYVFIGSPRPNTKFNDQNHNRKFNAITVKISDVEQNNVKLRFLKEHPVDGKDPDYYYYVNKNEIELLESMFPFNTEKARDPVFSKDDLKFLASIKHPINESVRDVLISLIKDLEAIADLSEKEHKSKISLVITTIKKLVNPSSLSKERANLNVTPDKIDI